MPELRGKAGQILREFLEEDVVLGGGAGETTAEDRGA